MKLQVLKEHISNYPNPIKFRVGDVLQLGKLDAEYPGWIRVRTNDGNEGWALVSDISITDGKNIGRAISSYCAKELNVKSGEELKIVKEKNGWYWYENKYGDFGWVPKEIGEST